MASVQLTTTPALKPRSVIPGRQRWDIGVLLARPNVAAHVERELVESGVRLARANPITGRLLVVHDLDLGTEEVGRLIAAAVARHHLLDAPLAASGNQRALPAPRPPDLGTIGSRAPISLAGVGTLALGLGALVLVPPVARLGVVLAATAAIVWRGWVRSARSQRTEVDRQPPRHPLRQIVGSNRRTLYLAAALSGSGAIMQLAAFATVGLISMVITTGPLPLLTAIGLASVSLQLPFLFGAAVLLLFVFGYLLYRAGVYWRDLAHEVTCQWRIEMYERVIFAELRDLEGEKSTRIPGWLTDDIEQFGNLLAYRAGSLVQTGMGFLVALLVFLWVAPSIAWVVFLPAPAIAWLGFSYQEQAASRELAASEADGLLRSQLIRSVQAVATIKSFVAEKHEMDHIGRLSDASLGTSHMRDIAGVAFGQLLHGIVIMSFFGLAFAAAVSVVGGGLPLGAYVLVIDIASVLTFRLTDLSLAVEQYHRTVAALGRVLKIRDLQLESYRGEGLALQDVNGEVVLEEVTFSYPNRPPALRSLSMRFAAKKTTAIVGITGAGKTTIARLVLRLHDVQSGRLLFDGVDVRDIKRSDLRTAIGYMSQDAILFDGTIADNIRYGSFGADQDRVVHAARQAAAHGFVDALPSRYDTVIGEKGVTLSGGERQRLALARVILKGAPVLILDEATSAVDNETEALIRHALKDFSKDRTMIVIAHRLSMTSFADWIYVIGAEGSIVEEGTHDELVGKGGMYAAMWRQHTGR